VEPSSRSLGSLMQSLHEVKTCISVYLYIFHIPNTFTVFDKIWFRDLH